jgi:nitrogen-specific signal transduction histidine kinase
MKQSDSLMPSPTSAHLPLETFLATADPVWVWDGKARRIIWANQAAARLWGDTEPARLKRRRLSRASDGLARMTELARGQHFNGEAIETLAFPTATGEAKAKCYLQPLQLAGDRPGLMVRVINSDAPATDAPMRPDPPSTEHPPDRTAPVRSAKAVSPSRPGSATRAPTASDQQTTRRERANLPSDETGAMKALAKDIGRASRDRRAAASAEPRLADAATTPRKRSAKAAAAAVRGASSPKTRVQAKSGPEPKTQSKTRPSPQSKAAPAKKTRQQPAPASGDGARQVAAPTPAAMTATDNNAIDMTATDMAALLARVSHEIRNPLTIIMGFAEILASERFHRMPQAKIREYVSDIYRTAAFALGLADDLLNYAEFASGEPDISPKPVDINALAADCLHLLGPLAASESIALRRRLSRDIPLVNGDARTLRQSLLNLLMNSMRHKDGSGLIRVSTRMNREGALVLSVKDDGPGMSKAQIDAALGPASDNGLKHAGRRGLGLRLVGTFVARNGAKLGIKSDGGKGTEVIVIFPPERLISRA